MEKAETYKIMGPRPGFEPGPRAPQMQKALDLFVRFMRVDLNLTHETIKKHKGSIIRFLRHVDKPIDAITTDDIREFLEDMKACYSVHHYSNFVKALKRFFRDFLNMPWLVESFRLPSKPQPVVNIPTKHELQQLYYTMDLLKHQALFLLFTTTGLRRKEVLTLRVEDVDIEQRLVYPCKQSSVTKGVGIGIFNHETQEVLEDYINKRKTTSNRLFPIKEKRLWARARDKTGIDVTPHILRKWHASELLRLGMNPIYVDVLQGRAPRSILARHYVHVSIDTLKKAYDSANLKVLS